MKVFLITIFESVKKYINKENIELEIFKLEEAYKSYLKQVQKGKTDYSQGIIDFYSSLITKVKNDYANNQMISELELNVIKKTNSWWDSLTNINFVPLTDIEEYDLEQQKSFKSALKNKGFVLINGVGYVNLELKGSVMFEF